MNDIQDTIDSLRRQHLILELAASALYNQVHGGPMPEARKAQDGLLLAAAVEAMQMHEEIEQLMRQRDRMLNTDAQERA